MATSKTMHSVCERKYSTRKTAFAGNHLPRKCGIATFTSDLLAAIASMHSQSDCFAVSVNGIEGGYECPNVVRFTIEEQALASYEQAADFINITNADIVCLQHEFGIFGGPAGSHLLALLDRLRAPVVTTLHTVLRHPNADQRRVMQELIARSARLAVMTEREQTILQEDYQATSRQCSAWEMASTITEDLSSGVWNMTSLRCCLTYRWSVHENYR